ncbi:hypothetical protein G9H71_10045 [Motilibacter sp. E257]|uniref:Replication-associated protein ORF2/G2P domain-containing protein n=1 Tax=Motilibacter deserti TaxID=2714956 RepID=A0ABX0GTK4_9ACTN|nr:hypothetical protein [Motilibacter deserti]
MAAPVGATWALSLYPEAAEGGGCFVPSRPPARRTGRRGAAEHPERARTEAARRARAALRRYCAANRLNRLGTLTYRGAGCHDPAQARADAAGFFRALRDGLGGRPLPYVWVPEWHKSGHGLHLHFAVGRFVRRSLIESSWGRGFVHIKLLGDLPVGAGPLGEARRAAGYLSKYVAKSFSDDDRPAGLHRYDVAQGFQPRKQRLTATSSAGVLAAASAVMGSAPERIWSSAEVEDWQGPPALWAQWAA